MDPAAAEELSERSRLSFAIADGSIQPSSRSNGLKNLSAGRFSCGYAVSPLPRGRGIATSALRALTTYAWTNPVLHPIQLNMEARNDPRSTSPSDVATYARAGGVVLRRYAASDETCCSMPRPVSERILVVR
jgi:[ribosomal protein S5]-alanine N-acetyltransferase